MLVPLIPHLAHECCEILNKSFYWPDYDSELLKDEKCKIVIQVNGRKRGIFEMPINSEENLVINKAKEVSNVKKNISNKKIIKQIYLKNKLVNFII